MSIERATLVLEGGATRGVFTSGVLDYPPWIMCRSSRGGPGTV